MIDQMSLDSYKTLDVSSQRGAILAVIRDNNGILSSRDIADITGIPRTSVTGRLRELERRSFIAKTGPKLDPVTNKMVNTYGAVKA